MTADTPETQPRKRVRQNYVDNKLLHQETAAWVKARKKAEKAGEPLPQMPEYTATAIMNITHHLSMKPNFCSYTFRHDMCGDAMEYCCRYLHNYNPNKTTNCFAYITQICTNAFIRRIQTEMKHSYIKARVKAESSNTVVQDGDTTDYDRHKGKNAYGVSAEQYDSDVIKRFENWKQNKKDKSAAMKEAKTPKTSKTQKPTS